MSIDIIVSIYIQGIKTYISMAYLDMGLVDKRAD